MANVQPGGQPAMAHPSLVQLLFAQEHWGEADSPGTSWQIDVDAGNAVHRQRALLRQVIIMR